MSNLHKAEKQEIMDLFVNIYTDFVVEREEETEITLRHIQLLRKLAESTNHDVIKMVKDFSDESISGLAKTLVDNWIPFEKSDTDKYEWRFESGISDEIAYLVIAPKTRELYMSKSYIPLNSKSQELLLKDVPHDVNRKCILDPAVVKKNYTENFDSFVKESIVVCQELLRVVFTELVTDLEKGYTDEQILQSIKEDDAELEELNEPQNAPVMFSTSSNDVSTSEINQVVAEEDKAKITCKV